jgi:tRNA pseudouridine38-40 synthase
MQQFSFMLLAVLPFRARRAIIPPAMHNIKLTLAYDGTDFHGWQIQPGQPTIQGLLAEVLQQLTQEHIVLYGAGRTDAGVHAWGQVANFSTSSALTVGDFSRGLNALLPPAIRIRAAEEVGSDFHARRLAQAKTYIYRIYRGRVVPPFHWRYVLHDPYPLDFAAMAEAARAFAGEHDFTTFAASSGSEEIDRDRVTLRAVYRSEMIAGSHDSSGPSALPSAGFPPDGLPWPLPAPDEWVYIVRKIFFAPHGAQDSWRPSRSRPRPHPAHRYSPPARSARPHTLRPHRATPGPLPSFRRISGSHQLARGAALAVVLAYFARAC